jgi:hypothetical protein
MYFLGQAACIQAIKKLAISTISFLSAMKPVVPDVPEIVVATPRRLVIVNVFAALGR